MTRLIVILVTAVFLGLLAILFFELGYVRFNYPDKAVYPVHGLDISHHQDVIDWDILEREDISFVIIKATEGGDHKDTKFEHNWQRAGEIGLVRGAYHFFTFCKTGKEQAQNFTETVPVEKDSLPPAIDLEFGGNCSARPPKEEVLREITEFARITEQKYGKTPIIYATRQSYRSFLEGEEIEYPIWIRNIYHKPTLPDGREWTFWQYANRGRLYGINGFVDFNVFNGSPQEFEEFVSSY
ncbi:MAG: GH25 family lysozyme [Thermodesulfobacteriota bacterium]